MGSGFEAGGYEGQGFGTSTVGFWAGGLRVESLGLRVRA